MEVADPEGGRRRPQSQRGAGGRRRRQIRRGDDGGVGSGGTLLPADGRRRRRVLRGMRRFTVVAEAGDGEGALMMERGGTGSRRLPAAGACTAKRS